MSTLSEKYSPPCATRWPTASISSNDSIHPYSLPVSTFSMFWIAEWCSGILVFKITFSPLGKVSFKKESSNPIFSAPPCANTDLESMSNNLYFTDELPQFNTNIFIRHALRLFFQTDGLITSNGYHFIDIIDRTTSGKIVDRCGDSLKNRTYGFGMSQPLNQFISDVAYFERREYQYIRMSGNLATRSFACSYGRNNRCVGLQLSIDF